MAAATAAATVAAMAVETAVADPRPTSVRQRAAWVAGLVAVLGVAWWLRSERTPAAPRAAPRARGPVPLAVRAVPIDRTALPTADAWRREVEPEGPLALRGTVIDEAGQPVVGARVAVRGAAGRTVVSDERGGWQVAGLVPRAYQLEAHKDDAWARAIEVTPGAHRAPVVLRLRAGAGIEVAVIDRATGAPVADAEVVLRDVAPVTATSDAAGIAKLRGLPPVSAFTLEVHKPGYARDRRLVAAPTAASAPAEVRVELEAAVALRGVVVDESGAPVADAAVTAIGADGVAGDVESAVRTGADGRFEIADADPRSAKLIARHPMHLPGTAPAETALDDAGATITLSPAALIHGRVVDRARAPAAYATVRAVIDARGSWRGTGERRVVADAAGAFVVQGLPPGRITLIADAPDATSVAPVLVELAAKTSAEVELVVDGQAALVGVAVDGSGQPVAGARVRCKPASTRTMALHCPGTEMTDAEGRFRIAGLPRGDYTVSVARSDALAATTPTRATAGGAEVRVVVADDGWLSGAVEVRGGARPPKLRASIAGRPHGTWVDAQGRFALRGLAPGRYSIELAGEGVVAQTIGPFVVVAGAATETGTTAIDVGRTVSGRVAVEGAPAAGVEVAVAPSLGALEAPAGLGRSPLRFAARTDASGHYRIDHVPTGALVAVASRPGARAVPVDVPAAGDAVVDLALAATGSVQGSITGVPRGGGCIVRVTDPAVPGTPPRVASCAADGRYRIELPPGGYAITVERAGLSPAASTLRVAAGQATRHDL